MRASRHSNRAVCFASSALLSGLLAFTAAGIAAARPQDQSQPPATAAAAKSAPSLDRRIGRALSQLNFYSVYDILHYTQSGGHVTLTGSVIHTTLKADAEAAVKKIEGVESVDNQIEILPVSAADDQIRHAEHRAIYSKAPLKRYAPKSVQGIHIIVKNGQVTLEGVVDSQGDKDLAGVAANTVPGAFSVTNNLVVQPGR
jgi:hyperosmotically inducible periplasmic protein